MFRFDNLYSSFSIILVEEESRIKQLERKILQRMYVEPEGMETGKENVQTKSWREFSES